VIVVGVGCSLGCSTEELLALIDASLDELDELGAGEPVAMLATVDRRAHEPGVVAAARTRGWPLTTFAAHQLAAVDVPTPSDVVAAHVGTPSVAEAAAVLAAGPGTLVLSKRRSAHATCAIARPHPEEAAAWPA
jgi:cobalamin biosynthesis protein CbiG